MDSSNKAKGALSIRLKHQTSTQTLGPRESIGMRRSLGIHYEQESSSKAFERESDSEDRGLPIRGHQLWSIRMFKTISTRKFLLEIHSPIIRPK